MSEKGKEIELKPCPFCGSRNVAVEYDAINYNPDEPRWYISCADCSANGCGEKDVVIARWNTRADALNSAERLKAEWIPVKSEADLPIGHKTFWLTVKEPHLRMPTVLAAYRNMYGFIRENGGLIPISSVLAYKEYFKPEPYKGDL